jgi:NitT/TauT family transport system substrate-binding protein
MSIGRGGPPEPAYLYLCLAIILVLAAACSPRADAPPAPNAPQVTEQITPSGAATAMPRQLRPLKTTYPTTAATQAPLWLARDAGIFAELGLDVEMALVTTGPTLLGAILSGETPISLAGGNQPIEANLQGADFVMLGSIMPYMPNAVYVHASIQSPQDLRGKVLGTSNYGSVTHVALRAAFERWGLEDGRDVSVIRTGGVPEILAAMESGLTMGGAFSPPMTFTARNLGYRELIDLAAARYEFGSAVPASTRRYVANEPAVVEQYLTALIRGVQIFKTDREFTVDVIARYAGIDDRPVAEETWAWYRDKLSDDLIISRQAVQNHLYFAAEQRPEALSASPEQFMDNSFVERLKAGGSVAR